MVQSASHEWNGAGLNLLGKTRVIKVDRTSILNNGMVAGGFLG